MTKKHLLLTLISFCTFSVFAQKNDDRLKPWLFGVNGGVNFSKTYSGDTFANNFTGRNKTGINLAGLITYDISDFVSINTGVGFISKGYRIYNDTLAINSKITRNLTALNLPLGFTFRQQFNKSRFITEKIGCVLNYSFGHNNDTFYNGANKKFRLVETSIEPLYPIVYLGIGMGGNTSKGNRFEFGLTYHQPLGNEMQLNISGGEFLNKSFLLNYRGGNLQATLTYHFNLGNFEKSEDYFY